MKSVLLTTRSQNTLLPNYPTLTYAFEVMYIDRIHMLEHSQPCTQTLHVGSLKSAIRGIFLLWESEYSIVQSLEVEKGGRQNKEYAEIICVWQSLKYLPSDPTLRLDLKNREN